MNDVDVAMAPAPVPVVEDGGGAAGGSDVPLLFGEFKDWRWCDKATGGGEGCECCEGGRSSGSGLDLARPRPVERPPPPPAPRPRPLRFAAARSDGDGNER